MIGFGRCLGCYLDLAEGFYHQKCSIALFALKTPPDIDASVEDIEQLAYQYINKGLAITGVQRKLSLVITDASPRRLTIVGGLGGNFIFKPPSPDYEQMPENEDLIMHLAAVCGIKTAQHGLLPMKDGALAYVTKRFDRKGKKKIAVEDLCQISELLTEQKYRSSYEQVGKQIRKYSSVPGEDVLRFFELLVFSFVVGNNDMHLKNFSLITEPVNDFRLSPAYDLLVVRLLLSVNEDPEEVALTLSGKKRKLNQKDFAACAKNLKISAKVCAMVLQKQLATLPSMMDFIDRSFLNPEQQRRLKEIITENSSKLENSV